MANICSGSLIIMALVLGVVSAFGDEAAPTTAYPVLGILQVHPDLQRTEFALSADETFEAIRERHLIYTGDGKWLRAVRDAKNRLGYDVPVIVYMGGFTTNYGGATEVETGYRGAVAMIDVTTLAESINAQTTDVTVKMPPDGECPIVASTADITDARDKRKYCFWLRVDDEMMKVLEVDEKTGRLRVERGFESAAAPHEAGATVFTPVYLGDRTQPTKYRSSNSWPGGRDYIRYALDPRADDAQRYKADLIIALMKTGYDGAWLDTFQPRPFNLCDPLGGKIIYFWDFRTGQRYDWDSYRAGLQEFLRGVRRKVTEAVGREPYLGANSVSGSYPRGGKLLFAAPDRPGLLDAYCFEDSYITPTGGKRPDGKLDVTFDPIPLRRWLNVQRGERDAALSGLRALCMIGPAGYVSAYINPSLENYEQLIRFSWCSYLLTVTRERTTYFGLPLLITKLGDRVGFLPLPDLCYYPIGDPVDNGDTASFKLPGQDCYMRRFTNGLVVVNPSDEAASVELPDGYVEPESNTPVKQVELSAGGGLLLPRAKR